MKKVLTTCGYCGCGCSFYVNVRDDEVIGVTPEAGHPVSQGKLCVKGWQGYTFVNHPDRLKQPLKRQRDGSFKEMAWEEAIESTAEELNRIIFEYGPEAIGVLSSARCTNEENYLMVKFARSVLRTSNIDHCARL
ncbi:MAG: spermidine/putrescine ABC transporter substrate-binding protein [Clostridia bacterium BRH_c25]|nr:MAG: spermidine/putrescine ABC transporter substrate-binding protein [Clostridia bacterium BRH_c25]